MPSWELSYFSNINLASICSEFMNFLEKLETEQRWNQSKIKFHANWYSSEWLPYSHNAIWNSDKTIIISSHNIILCISAIYFTSCQITVHVSIKIIYISLNSKWVLFGTNFWKEYFYDTINQKLKFTNTIKIGSYDNEKLEGIYCFIRKLDLIIRRFCIMEAPGK